MVTEGYMLHRYKGYYFVRYVWHPLWDPGVEILQSIPTDPQDFAAWIKHWTENLDRELIEQEIVGDGARDNQRLPWLSSQTCLTSCRGSIVADAIMTNANPVLYDYYISRNRTQVDLDLDGPEWEYEIDFDNMIFHVDNNPWFRLDHMPSEQVFLNFLGGFNSYGHVAPPAGTPIEHRYQFPVPERARPSDIDLSDYEIYAAENRTADIHELLDVSEELIQRDKLQSALLQSLVGQYLLTSEAGKIYPLLPTFVERQDLPDEVVHATHDLVRLSVSPRGACLDIPNTDETDLLDVVWMRADMFLWIATEWHNEDYLKATIAQAMRAVKKYSKQGIFFGIICSLIHIVIVRIESTSGKLLVKHTTQLQFLPSAYAVSPTTPGIIALARLAGRPDRNFVVHTPSVLSACRIFTFEDAKPQIFPTEIWLLIADSLFDPNDLVSFGCTSRQCRVAVADILRSIQLPSLRLTEVIDMHSELIRVNNIVKKRRYSYRDDPGEWSRNEYCNSQMKLYYACFKGIDQYGPCVVNFSASHCLGWIRREIWRDSKTDSVSALHALHKAQPTTADLCPAFFSYPESVFCMLCSSDYCQSRGREDPSGHAGRLLRGDIKPTLKDHPNMLAQDAEVFTLA